ncbi:hypothetical protein [Alteribacillus sp. HJP-4]|uniref:hypothetical protein n=1 Tax=Alteribacillus sp. HJP-4 TaxID=2775394 RepID=UPI0035CD02C9
MRIKEIYYDHEKKGYCVVKEDIFRTKLFEVHVFYPAPSNLKFEEVEKLFTEQINEELLPVLKQEYLQQIFKDN